MSERAPPEVVEEFEAALDEYAADLDRAFTEHADELAERPEAAAGGLRELYDPDQPRVPKGEGDKSGEWTSDAHAVVQGVVIEKGPTAFLVKLELEGAKLPDSHLDGLGRIGFVEGDYVKSGLRDAYGVYYPDTRRIVLASNAAKGSGNIHVFGGNTTLHEVGHHVHLAKMTDAAADEWTALSDNGQGSRISAYARTNRGEHFAEAYRAYTSGGDKRKKLKALEPRAYKFMQDLMRPSGSKNLLPPGEFATGDWVRRYTHES